MVEIFFGFFKTPGRSFNKLEYKDLLFNKHIPKGICLNKNTYSLTLYKIYN